MKDKHYAYLAGMLDGDGCFMAYVAQSGGQTWYKINLSANSVESKAPNRLRELFGGSVKPRTRPHYKNGIIFEWRLCAKAVVRQVVQQVRPFLVLKKEQADLTLTFLDLARGCPETREGIIREIQRLNQQERSKGDLVDFGDMKWPYLAGLMDAEGTFSVRRDERESSVHYGIWARLANTNQHVMDWLEQSFGIKPFGEDTCTYWPLPYGRQDKERFLLHLLPYLVTKKEQAKTLLEYIRLGDAKNPVVREALFQKCFDLNHPELEVTNLRY